MRIALCEDHEPDLVRLKQSIERCLEAQNLKATVAAFARPVDYLAYMARAGATEISFLDIYMGDMIVTMTLAALAQQLNDPRFLDCHRSFIVNMDHI